MQPKAPAPRPPENKKRRTSFRMSFLVRWKRFELPTFCFVVRHSIQLSYQRRCKIYTTTDIGVCQLFFSKKNEFFSRRKKSRRKPRLAAAGPSLRLAPERPPRLLCQTPARPFLPRQRRHSSFLILSAGGTAVSPSPGTGPVRLSRRRAARALPCARKESAPLPCSPLLPGAETGLHPGKNKKPGHPRRGGRTGVFRCQAMKLR